MEVNSGAVKRATKLASACVLGTRSSTAWSGLAGMATGRPIWSSAFAMAPLCAGFARRDKPLALTVVAPHGMAQQARPTPPAVEARKLDVVLVFLTDVLADGRQFQLR